MASPLNIKPAVNGVIRPPEPQVDPTKPPRDRYGRPKVILPAGGKTAYYARASSFGEILDDKRALGDWMAALAAAGAARFPGIAQDLRELDLEDLDDRKKAKAISKELQSLMGRDAKAQRGTELHEATEAVDDGKKHSVKGELARVVDNYQELMDKVKAEHDYQVAASELFGVNDDLLVAGTLDRLAWVDGKLCVVDIKSSGSLAYSMAKFSLQFGSYAGMVRYNHVDAQLGRDLRGLGVGRLPLLDGHEVDREVAWIIWIPQDGSRAEFGKIHIDRTNHGARLVREVKDWRNFWNRKAQKFQPTVTL